MYDRYDFQEIRTSKIRTCNNCKDYILLQSLKFITIKIISEDLSWQAFIQKLFIVLKSNICGGIIHVQF